MKIGPPPYSTFWNICNCLISFPPCLLRTRSNRGRLVEVQSTHIFLKEYFSTSLLPAVFPFFIIFHHPDFFTPTASSSDLVFPLKIAAWMGQAAITNSFPSRLLESDNAAGKHNTTQHNTTQHNTTQHDTTIWSIAFLVVAEAEKKSTLKKTTIIWSQLLQESTF